MKTAKTLLASSFLVSAALASPNLSEIHPDNFDSQVFSLGIPVRFDISDAINGKDKSKAAGIKLTNKATLYNSYGDSEFYWRGGGAYLYDFETDAGNVEAHLAFGDTFLITEHSFINGDLEFFYHDTVGSGGKKDKKDKGKKARDLSSYGGELSATYGFRLSDGIDMGIKGAFAYGQAKYNGESGNVKSTYLGVPFKFNMGEGVYINLDAGYQTSNYSIKSAKDTHQGVVNFSISWKYSM